MGHNLRFLEKVVPATVSLHAMISRRNPSVWVLGRERMGSGAIITDEGHILTVGYIVIGAVEIGVTLPDGRRFPGSVFYQDYESGLALVKIDGEGLPVARLGSSADIKQGDTTLILASTGDEERRCSLGFVSAVRPFDTYWEYMLDKAIITTVLNPGFGGGPLLDHHGMIIGTVSLNLNTIREMSLAIPIELFHNVKDEVLSTGKISGRVPRPWLGLYTAPTEKGLVVVETVPNGPAGQSGVQSGDIIVDVSGIEVSDRRDLYEVLWKHMAGEEMVLTTMRDDELMVFKVRTMDRAAFYRQV